MAQPDVPRTADELRQRINSLAFLTAKVSPELIKDFCSTILYRDGHIGHMVYAPIKKALDPSEFERFLAFLGITDEMFAKNNGLYCASFGAAGPGCSPADDYCNREWCNLPVGEPKK
ncbi:hypothetical protein [Paraburkholderia sediminicola]|uniref:hypothetical protein n=1 Tax=Paraburkholderia sediminicola TaxID=458836 RepID=UPI0038B911BB